MKNLDSVVSIVGSALVAGKTVGDVVAEVSALQMSEAAWVSFWPEAGEHKVIAYADQGYAFFKWLTKIAGCYFCDGESDELWEDRPFSDLMETEFSVTLAENDDGVIYYGFNLDYEVGVNCPASGFTEDFNWYEDDWIYRRHNGLWVETLDIREAAKWEKP